MRGKFLILLIVFFLFLTACTPRHLRPVLYREATLDELIELIQRRENRIKTIKASFKMGFSDLTKKGSQHCLGVLIVEKPDRIRIKGYLQMGPTLFEIVSDGKCLWVYIPKEGKAYYTHDITGRTLKSDFNLQNLSNTFFISEMISRADITKSLGKGEREYIIYLNKEKRLLERIWIERSEFLVTKIERFANDNSLALGVYFEEYQKIDDIAFPKEVKIDNPKERTMLTLLIQRVRLNETITPEVFQFKMPQGTEFVDLDRGD